MPRGYGWARNPKKYAYNKIYQKTSFDIFSVLKSCLRVINSCLILPGWLQVKGIGEYTGPGGDA